MTQMSAPEHISGVRAEGDRFAVRWEEGGASRMFKRKAREAVEAKRAELLGFGDAQSEAGGSLQLPTMPEFTGRADWFKAATAALIAFCWDACNRRDSRALEAGRKLARTVAEMSHAYLPHAGYDELYEVNKKLTDFVEGQQRRKSDAAQRPGDSCINSTLEGRTGPDPTVR
jgi:hypothetical protein